MRFLPIFYLCLPLLPLPASAQEPLTVGPGCHFADADAPTDLYAYEPSAEAKEILEKLMNVNVLPQNFVLRAADCSNALATSVGKQRYILYSTAFLENFKKEARTQWAAYCVLAHEIGHHLSNHDLSETSPVVRKRYELEADRFAGGTLFRLGATLEEAQAGINTFSSDKESGTHPPKRARLEALANGWKQAQELAGLSAETDGAAAEDSDEKKLYKQALAEKDPYRAIELLDQALEIKEDYAEALLERGVRKIDIEDVDEIRVNYGDAIADLNEYMKLRSKNPRAYLERGYAYRRLDRDSQALSDYNQAIRIDAKNAEAYLGRAWVKMKMEQPDAALRDLDKASQIDPNLAEAHYWRGNIRYGMGDWEKAIADFDLALKADPKHSSALNLRAASKQSLTRYAEAVADFNQLQALDPETFDSYFNRAECFQSLNKHREAIADLDVLLKKNADIADAYLNRGVSKQLLGQTAEAEKDYRAYFERRVYPSDLVRSLPSLQTAHSRMAVYQTQLGCLLVHLGHAKEGFVWLDLALEARPDLEKAKGCRGKR